MVALGGDRSTQTPLLKRSPQVVGSSGRIQWSDSVVGSSGDFHRLVDRIVSWMRKKGDFQFFFAAGEKSRRGYGFRTPPILLAPIQALPRIRRWSWSSQKRSIPHPDSMQAEVCPSVSYYNNTKVQNPGSQSWLPASVMRPVDAGPVQIGSAVGVESFNRRLFRTVPFIDYETVLL